MLENHIIAHRYQVETLLAYGGNAWVYRAFDRQRNKLVALRYLRFANEQAEWEYQRELRLVKKLEHKHIIRYLDDGNYQSGRYVIMPLLAETAAQRYHRPAASPEEVQERLEQVLPILDALAYLHSQGIIHADIKASNILFDKYDTPVLCDFGVAHDYTLQRYHTTSVQITLSHVSPEAAQSSKLSPSSDLYSLGCFFYEMLIGAAPFGTGNQPELIVRHLTETPHQAHSLNAHISPALSRVFSKLLEKSSAQRYQSIAELQAALDEAFANPLPRSEALLLDINELSQQLPASVWQTLQATSLCNNGVNLEQLSQMLNTDPTGIELDMVVLLEQKILECDSQKYYHFVEKDWQAKVAAGLSSRRQRRYLARLEQPRAMAS